MNLEILTSNKPLPSWKIDDMKRSVMSVNNGMPRWMLSPHIIKIASNIIESLLTSHGEAKVGINPHLEEKVINEVIEAMKKINYSLDRAIRYDMMPSDALRIYERDLSQRKDAFQYLDTYLAMNDKLFVYYIHARYRKLIDSSESERSGNFGRRPSGVIAKLREIGTDDSNR